MEEQREREHGDDSSPESGSIDRPMQMFRQCGNLENQIVRRTGRVILPSCPVPRATRSPPLYRPGEGSYA